MTTKAISIEPLSQLLLTSGEAGENIDANLVFGPYGFPYIPGKRFKGLLRESMIEVLEMEQYATPDIIKKVEAIFGVGGHADFIYDSIEISNFYVEGYHEVKSKLDSKNLPPKSFRPYVLSYFTKIIQQTAINAEGIAADKSLRNYRVLKIFDKKSRIKFVGEIRLPSGVDETIWANTLNNLRRAGLRRNRGFGKIRVTGAVPSKSLRNTDQKELADNNKFRPSSRSFYKIGVHLKSPIVLSRLNSEQNTIFSEDQISGNRLRGVLARLYLEKYKRADETFAQLFLRNHLVFNELQKDGRRLKPNAIQLEKYRKEQNPMNVLEEQDPSNIKIAKKWNAHFNSDYTHKIDIDKSHQFHGSRQNRAAGRNMKSDDVGGIFYIESIDAGQSFYGTIDLVDETNHHLFQHFDDLIRDGATVSIGKSKSAQYGKVMVSGMMSTSPIESTELKKGGHYYMVLDTPMLLKNDLGFPQPTAKTLIREIEKNIEIKSATTSITHIEQYNHMWKSKSGKQRAFDAGSTFLIEAKEEILDFPMQIGECQDQGLGRISLIHNDEINAQIAKIKATVQERKESQMSSSIEEIFDFDDEPENSILKKINTKIKDDEVLVKQRASGIKEAIKFPLQGISSSLVSKMYATLSTQNKQEFSKFMEKIKTKPAGVQLERKNIYNRIKQAHDKNQVEHFKAFFETLRKRLKTKDDD